MPNKRFYTSSPYQRTPFKALTNVGIENSLSATETFSVPYLLSLFMNVQLLNYLFSFDLSKQKFLKIIS